jgi:hypothetical protein
MLSKPVALFVLIDKIAFEFSVSLIFMSISVKHFCFSELFNLLLSFLFSEIFNLLFVYYILPLAHLSYGNAISICVRLKLYKEVLFQKLPFKSELGPDPIIFFTYPSWTCKRLNIGCVQKYHSRILSHNYDFYLEILQLFISYLVQFLFRNWHFNPYLRHFILLFVCLFVYSRLTSFSAIRRLSPLPVTEPQI